MTILPVILLVAGALLIVLLPAVIIEVIKGVKLGKDASAHINANKNVGILESVYPNVRKELRRRYGEGNEEKPSPPDTKSALFRKNSPKN